MPNINPRVLLYEVVYYFFKKKKSYAYVFVCVNQISALMRCYFLKEICLVNTARLRQLTWQPPSRFLFIYLFIFSSL